MGGERQLNAGRGRKSAADLEREERQARTKKIVIGAALGLVVLFLGVFLYFTVFRGPSTGTTDPEAKLRLERLFAVYKKYADEHKDGKGPPNEKVFKDYIAKLPQEDKAALKIGEDIDASLLTNPRDNQKYEVRYGMTIDPAGATRAVAWEATGGKDGTRYVALSMGYVEPCDEQTFNDYKK